ncbi:MAG TPA: DUF2694 family protein [Mycobacterium sp.]
MAEPDQAFDAAHPSGHILFRSCRGGYLHSVALTEAAMDTDARTLAEAIVLAADVSFLRAALQVRGEIVAAGHSPSASLPTIEDLESATERLLGHQLRHPER